MKLSDYVLIGAVNGGYRYGYIADILDKGLTLVISLSEEGESKIAYDAAYNALTGQESIDYVSIITEVEKQIVPLLAAGYNTKEIAGEMSISPRTVRSHLWTLRIKLHLDDRAQLIAFSPALDAMIKKQAGVDAAVEAVIGR
ncbi:hypothetical protein LCGC14_0654910 [marine sediment metagenome]|uniref:HTH luxR-type domain-containing protein n=1 Tax=marine sediment metagenome TaxID=412755 RepID=A0A0F9R0F4_9ZZZZ